MIFKRDQSHPHKRARRVNGGRKLGVRRNDEREDFEGGGRRGGRDERGRSDPFARTRTHDEDVYWM